MTTIACKYNKINWFQPCFLGNERSYLQEAFDSTWISEGSFISRFEAKLGNILGNNNVLCVSNGTVALMLAMMCENIGPGDEVIVPGYGFAAVANVTCILGAKPIFVDVDQDTWCIHPDAIEKAVTNKTKIIVAIHNYGNMCDMPAIMKIAKQHKIVVIEYVAEAIFSTLNNQNAGTFGDYGCFSFHATKTITTGEGGAVIFNNNEKKELGILIRSHGMKSGLYNHVVVGMNFRLTNLQAAIGLAQLEKSAEIITKKKNMYENYINKLNGIEELIFQVIPSNVKPIMWAVACRINNFKKDRDSLFKHLQTKGIECRKGFGKFSTMPAFSHLCNNTLSNSEKLTDSIISFPSYTSITIEIIEYITEHIKKFFIME